MPLKIHNLDHLLSLTRRHDCGCHYISREPKGPIARNVIWEKRKLTPAACSFILHNLEAFKHQPPEKGYYRVRHLFSTRQAEDFDLGILCVNPDHLSFCPRSFSSDFEKEKWLATIGRPKGSKNRAKVTPYKTPDTFNKWDGGGDTPAELSTSYDEEVFRRLTEIQDPFKKKRTSYF
jgi:hypothetical protein